jgi:hypothetical protein
VLATLAALSLADTTKIGFNTPRTGCAAADGRSDRIGAQRTGEATPQITHAL